MSDIIKTTARFQEATEPIKQRPIIQVERPLPNTIRASVDSGRDNPFRPDGKIYKSADPIVDFYKFGPNQSRPVSPTESELLINGTLSEKEKKKQKKKKQKNDTKSNGLNKDGTKKKSCWRRWLCCCCCCCNKNKDKVISSEPVEQATQIQDVKTKDLKQTKIVVLKEKPIDSSILDENNSTYIKNVTNANESMTLDVKRTEPTLVFSEPPKPESTISTQVNIKTTKLKSIKA